MDAAPPRRRRRRWLLRLALSLVVLLLVLRWFEHRMTYAPFARMDATGDELGRPREDVYFTTKDGVKLNAWFYPAATDSSRARLVFLIAHGNGGNISHRVPLYDALLSRGTAVFAFDYRGYGCSAGRPDEEGTYLDAQAAHAWLVARGFAPTNILAYAESLGGGIVTELALREKVGGVILQSCFSSVHDIGAEMLPWLPVRWVTHNRYDNAGKLPRMHAPLLVMHGRADTIIGFHHGEKLFAAANEPKLFWELAGDHNDQPLADRVKFVAGVEKFLGELVKAPPLMK
ncbi:MAG: alpha/beta hydrolase [Verrucomicrobia bacterium]|nr:alpha/beta hydrolase [Verrucomicrobiota bacterium]